MPAGSSLAEYQAKRDFRKTEEPAAGAPARKHKQPIFVIQEHHASKLHYDFRLEHDGVLKSWAVPREPSLNPADKRLAVQVEDHPIPYAKFHGTIPHGQYGAGKVYIWDHGTFEPAPDAPDFDRGLEAGKLEFILHGEKLNGRFALVRMRVRDDKNWLLIKMRDQFARASGDGKPAIATPGRTRSRPVAAAKSVRSGRMPAKVELTNADRVWFPDDGITKGDVFRYYEAVADFLIPFLRDRPVTLERLPGGIGPGEPHFWQKHTPEYYPAWIPRVDFPGDHGRSVKYVLVNDAATLLYLVNQGAITFHPWLSRVPDPDRPDCVLIDLDPGRATFSDAVLVAKALHHLLDREGVTAVVKTSGKSGLHVLVPWKKEGDFAEARTWAREVAEQVVEAFPELATIEFHKAGRGKRVYIDVLQNASGHHAVAPYVVRPVPGAPVSMPLEWRELTPRLRPGQFTIKTALRRLSRQRRDPMAALFKSVRRNR